MIQSMHQNGPCRICNCSEGSGATVRLWDGRCYCRGCVEAVCPELFDYAVAHDRLEESPPHDRAALWLAAWRMEAWIVLAFALLFAVAGYQRDGLVGILIGIVVAVLVTAVQAAIQLPMFVRVTQSRMPIVSVVDGQVTFRRGFQSKRRQWSAPLQDFRWRAGRSRQDTYLRNTLVPARPVVLLLLRRGRWRIFGEERVACGWTDETRRIWIGFLKLAGIPAA